MYDYDQRSDLTIAMAGEEQGWRMYGPKEGTLLKRCGWHWEYSAGRKTAQSWRCRCVPLYRYLMRTDFSRVWEEVPHPERCVAE